MLARSLPSRLANGSFESAMWLWALDALVLSQLPSPASGRFLDVGCGAGLLSLTAASMGFDVTAVDLSPQQIACFHATIAGSAEAPRISARVGDAQTLEGLGDASFGVVGSSFGIFMVPDRVAAWASARRVLVPGGRLFATSWDPSGCPHVSMFRYLAQHAADRPDATAPEIGAPNSPLPVNRTADAASFRDELLECGFENVRVHTLSHPILFQSGEQLLADLLSSEWVRSMLGHKDELSLQRASLHYVQLVLHGDDPFAANTEIPASDSLPVERHALWTQSFALPARAHVAIATKAASVSGI